MATDGGTKRVSPTSDGAAKRSRGADGSPSPPGTTCAVHTAAAFRLDCTRGLSRATCVHRAGGGDDEDVNQMLEEEEAMAMEAAAQAAEAASEAMLASAHEDSCAGESSSGASSGPATGEASDKSHAEQRSRWKRPELALPYMGAEPIGASCWPVWGAPLPARPRICCRGVSYACCCCVSYASLRVRRVVPVVSYASLCARRVVPVACSRASHAGGRPNAPTPHDATVFQWTAIDMYTDNPLRAHPNRGSRMPGSNVGPVPVVRLYGVTAEGHSVLAHVYGFTPYCYCSAPVEFDEAKHTNTLTQTIDAQLKGAATGDGKKCTSCVLGIDTERDKSSLMG